MSELGGSDWDDEEVEGSPWRGPAWELPWPQDIPEAYRELGDDLERDEVPASLEVPTGPTAESLSFSTDWDELLGELSDALETTGDTPFAGDELATVRSALHDAQKEIMRLEKVNAAQLALVESLSEQLGRATDRIGRKDWLIMSIGAGTALVIAGVVPSAFMLHVGAKFFHEIAHLFD